MTAAPERQRKIRQISRRLVRDTKGVALVEFAYSLPILMIMLASGLELANAALTTKRVGDLAATVADNASRMGERSNGLSVRQISEAEINDVFTGADLQADLSDFRANGRIILSSLQRNADDGQWIAWQRCFGDNGIGSTYGIEGDGATGTSFAGMGPTGNTVQAPTGTALMVVEVHYNYEPFFPIFSLPARTMTEFAVFNVRELRDLAAPGNAEDVEVASCEVEV
jgi:hypothetical protein